MAVPTTRKTIEVMMLYKLLCGASNTVSKNQKDMASQCEQMMVHVYSQSLMYHNLLWYRLA